MRNNNFLNTPVLLTLWRRPNETKRVIKAIKEVKPKKLFIACDGARSGNKEEFDKVKKTIEVCKKEINWDCEVIWKISEKNLGCKTGVTNAINWFFDHVNEGIIMEDDNLAHPDFFWFCENLLERYRFDKRVWSISGTNNQDGKIRGDGSYYFGKIPLVWGWATWKDRWKENDVDMSKWPEVKAKKIFDEIFNDQIEREYWENIFETFYEKGIPDTYDYQWVFTCLINNGLIIVPNNNLINNIGFNIDATHTKWEKTSVSKVRSIGKEIVHPQYMFCDTEAEKYQFDYYFGGLSTRLKKNILLRTKRKIKRLLNIKNLK